LAIAPIKHEKRIKDVDFHCLNASGLPHGHLLRQFAELTNKRIRQDYDRVHGGSPNEW